MFLSNRAGQVVNDIKDLVESGIYGREKFSDVKSGTLTIPLIMMKKEMEANERMRLENLFGKGDISRVDQDWLIEMVESRLPKSRLFEYVVGIYDDFLKETRSVVENRDLRVFVTWYEYKINQVVTLLTNEK